MLFIISLLYSLQRFMHYGLLESHYSTHIPSVYTSCEFQTHHTFSQEIACANLC